MPHSLRGTYSCPVEFALEMLNGKWKPVILAHLKEGTLRYGQLRALVPKLSDKMLAQRLKDLEEQGLVARQKRGARGAPSSYRLTARGLSLAPALQALYDCGERIAREVGATIERPNR